MVVLFFCLIPDTFLSCHLWHKTFVPFLVFGRAASRRERLRADDGGGDCRLGIMLFAENENQARIKASGREPHPKQSRMCNLLKGLM